MEDMNVTDDNLASRKDKFEKPKLKLYIQLKLNGKILKGTLLCNM